MTQVEYAFQRSINASKINEQPGGKVTGGRNCARAYNECTSVKPFNERAPDEFEILGRRRARKWQILSNQRPDT